MSVNIGGIVPLSTVDWHGKSSVVLFLNGCPFRCGYCHNYNLLAQNCPTELSRVKKRILESKPFISSVVFLGGEPLMQGDAVEEIAVFAKENGLFVGIHTNGFYPDAVKNLIDKNLADKFFIDIKAPFEQEIYGKTIGVISGSIFEKMIPNIQKTLEIVDKSSVDLEIKTTVFPKVVGTKEQIDSISKWINENILQKQKMTYVLQQGKGGNSNDPVFREMTFLSPEEMDELAEIALKNLKDATVVTQTDEEGRVIKTFPK